jgi:hypothetical protein
MQYYRNTLAVEARWLIGSGILTKPGYNMMIRRGKITRLNRAAYCTPALVAYDSLPERLKCEIQKIVPDPHKVAGANMVEERIRESAEASNFFDEYKLNDGRFLPQATRREYYANAIVLQAVGRLLEDKKSKRATLGKRALRNWDQIAAYVQEVDRSRYPHSLPASARRLENKYKDYTKNGYMCLIHKNFANKNAAKVDDAIKESVMMEVLAAANNLDNAQVCKVYNTIASRSGWKQITASTVAIWREKKDIVIYPGRRGSTEFMNNKAMQVKRVAPAYPLYYLTLDGWDVELLYQQFNQVDSRTTYHNRPTVVVVLDACVKYPLGYAVGTHETPALIQEALRNAEKHVQELFGQMYRAQQIQSDRYAISKMTPYYAAIAEKVTPARAKNAKSKIIEPYFNSINKKYCQLMKNWSGFGITSDKEKQPNTEYLNKYKSTFPDFTGVCKQIDQIIQIERNEKIGRYKELWEKMPEEHKIPMSYEKYLLAFGETTGYKNALQGSGLKVTIQGQKRDYDCFDLSFREHSYEKWEVRFDPDDLTKVLAVNENETLQYMMEEKYVQPMSLIERKPGDHEQLQRVHKYNEQLRQHVIDIRSNNADNLSGTIESINELDTLFKLQLTDSKGQHKNRRNDHRAITADAVVVEENENDFYDIF